MAQNPRMTKATLEVLDVLYQGPEKLYGLKIAQGTGLMTGTVYPILARLENIGWVTSVWEQDEGPDVRGARRRFYQLTPMGREHARAALRERAARESRTAHHRPETGLA
ncbi:MULTISPECIES: helix-turn-helix transcriptional regulator [unclassified Streptomyces]|uniref:PadR family transcriptional regulator n=1 Tax=unclassified Streptomyces TaxID=2593676 RepID=UPI001926B240|nr:helix-turn-helix transcriptional regulator [Streptomyces sp. SID4985]